MGIIDDIKKMQAEGRSEMDMMRTLQNKGNTFNEIQDALAQARIKDAVTAPDESYSSQMQSSSEQESAGVKGMEPSMLSPPQQVSASPATQSQNTQEYEPYQQYNSQHPQQYQEYSQYSAPSASADTIAEIAEQVVIEKLRDLRANIEKAVDLKNTVETRIDSIDARMQKIERIIDQLQIALLQKVTESLVNIGDIKTELQETQKTFKALLPKVKTSSIESN